MPEQDVPASVLVVDDERGVADLHAAALDPEYAVQTAYSGEEALDLLVHDPDVILLDRRIPGLSGDEVLEEIRARGIDARVAFVTAISPDVDVVGLPFDDYLVKPVGPDDLRSTVERLLLQDRLEDRRAELRSRRATRRVLEAELSTVELRESEKFDELLDRIEELEAEIDRIETRLDDATARGIAPEQSAD